MPLCTHHALPSVMLDLIVQLENTSYQVPEGDGFIEVCAVLSNPASQDVVLTASAVEKVPAEAKGMKRSN